MLAPQASLPAPTEASGSQKRQRKNSLPRPIYLYDNNRKVVFAAALCIQATTTPGASNVDVSFARCVALSEPFPLGRDQFKYFGAVFTVQPPCESSLRSQPVLVGATVGTHFVDWALERSWKAIYIQSSAFAGAYVDPSVVVTIQIKATTFKQFGVVPTMREVGVPPAEPVAVADLDGDDDHPAEVAEPPLPLPRVRSPPTPIWFTIALERLATERGGAITHVFTPECLLRCLELAYSMKRSASIHDVLATSAVILLGDAAQGVAADIRRRDYRLPSIGVLRTARIRLDYLRITFEQQLWLRGRVIHFILVDSSPQLGYNILCVIEDTFVIPEPHTVNAHMHLNSVRDYTSQIKTLSSLGLGRAGLVKKTLNTGRLTLMDSPSELQFHVKRKRYRGCVADQGTEQGIGDMSLRIFGLGQDIPAASSESYFYPLLLQMPGMLHILYDALELAVKACPQYKGFVDTLRTTANFLNNKQVRQRFQAVCFEPGDPCVCFFNTGVTCHIDWKWEFLSIALDETLPKYCIIRKRLDVKKMITTETGSLDSNAIKEMASAIADDMYEGVAEAYRMFGKVVEHTARELEICCCHHSFWETFKTRKRRLAAMEQSTGSKRCCWMGRRLAWFIALGKAALFSAIRNGMCDALSIIMATLPEARRLNLVIAVESLRLKLSETLEEKLGFLDHCPYIAIGAFYSTIDGELPLAKQRLQVAVDEYDEAVAAGNEDRLHRVAQRLFRKHSPIRNDVDAWLASTEAEQLWAHVYLYLALMEYALMPLVERRIEAVHARVKWIGKLCSDMSLAQICALLREGSHYAELKTCAEFAQHCIDNWRRRNVLDSVLRLWVPAPKLRTLSVQDKIRAVYQTGLTHEHDDITEPSRAHAEWLVLTACHRRPVHSSPAINKAFVALLKSWFHVGGFFSMPAEMVCLCSGDGGPFPRLEGPHRSPLEQALLAIAEPTPVCTWDQSKVVFRVLNNAPERRKLVDLHHLDRQRSTITVAKCSVMSRAAADMQLIVQVTDENVKLQLDHLMSEMHDVMLGVARWSVKKSVAMPRMRPISRAAAALVDGASVLPVAAAGASLILRGAAPLVDIGRPARHADMNSVVVQLARRGAFVGQSVVPFLSGSFDGIDVHILQDMEGIGAVVLTTDDFGDLQVALNPRFLDWTHTLGLTAPVPFSRLETLGAPLSKHKLELIFVLHRAGWSDAVGALGSLIVGGQHIYNRDIGRPLSYFAALVLSDTLFQKGVTHIEHDWPDAAYRCLITLRGDALAAALAHINSDERSNTVLLAFLAKEDLAPTEDEPRPGNPFNGLEDWQAPPLMDSAPMLPPVVEQAGWVRVVAHVGDGSNRLKIYFDNFSHGGSQRAFVDCRHHACIWCRNICRDSKRRFCAYLYAWEAAGGHVDISSKPLHLAHTPSEACIDIVEEQLVLEEF